MNPALTSIVLGLFLLAPASLPALAFDAEAICASAGFGSGTHSLAHGGITRTFRVHVPAGHAAGSVMPLVVYFHGWGGDEDEFIGHEGITRLADQRGYVLAAPRGLGSGPPDFSFNSWTFSGSASGVDGDGVNPAVAGDSEAICDPGVTPDYAYPSCECVAQNTCSWTHCQADDVDFAVKLVAHLGEKLCVDSERVYAMGGSNGGMFTWELGQNPASAPVFRAIAPLIGLPHRGYLAPPGKAGDMPVIVITGNQDRTVPPGHWDDANYTTTSNGSDRFFYTGATAITRSWAAAHGCDTSSVAQPFDDGHAAPDCRSFCGDGPGWPRVLDCRAEMGHVYDFGWSWPLILDFFDAHARHRDMTALGTK